MNSIADYKIGFGKTAKTLLYEDSSGTILFGFDVSPSNDPSQGKWTIGLERPISQLNQASLIKDEQLRIVEQKRIEAAFERAKAYLLSCGYQVKIWPDEFETVR